MPWYDQGDRAWLARACNYVFISTFGFIPPWLFLGGVMEMQLDLQPSALKGVVYGGWFLIATIAGRVALKRTNLSNIRKYCFFSATSLVAAAFVLVLFQSWVGVALAVFISASVSGATMFGPIIGSAVRQFPSSQSVAVAFATVGQLTAASVAESLQTLVDAVSNGIDTQAGSLLLAALGLVIATSFLKPPNDVPLVSIERTSRRVIGVAFAFSGFCVTFGGTVFILNLPELAGSVDGRTQVFAAFSLSALAGRVSCAFLQDYSSLRMHIASSAVLSSGLGIIACFEITGRLDLVLLVTVAFSLGYGGVTPTYIAKQREFFSGSHASKQSLNFFVFASLGIVLGCMVGSLWTPSTNLIWAFSLSICNLFAICWISSQDTPGYGSIGKER